MPLRPLPSTRGLLLLALALCARFVTCVLELEFDEDFLLSADVGASGLSHLQPLLTSAYRGAAFYAHITQAERHTQHRRIADAASSYAYVLSNYALSDVDAAPVHLALGNALSHLGRAGEAEQEYKSAAQARKYAHISYYCLGLLYIRTGRTTDAAQALETALFFRPSFFSAVHAMGSLHIIKGNVEKGLRMYESALQLLVDSGVLLAEGEGGGPPPPPAPPVTAQDYAQQQLYREREQLGHHLVTHVMHVFRVPTESVGTGGGGVEQSLSHRAAAAEHGKSLRRFLGRVSTMDLAALHRGLGLQLADTGALQDGLAHLRRAVSLSPTEFGHLLLWATLAQPVTYADGSDVWNTRAATVKNVRQALEDRVTVVHPESLFELYQLQYQLPFSGLPAHLLIRDIARLFASSEVPVLPFSAPRLFGDYPRAVAAVGGAAERAASVRVHADGGAASPVPIIPAVGPRTNPFLLRSAPAVAAAAGLGKAATQAASPVLSSSAGSSKDKTAVIRVGFLTYQAFDCPTGHLLNRVMAHMRGYTAAMAGMRKGKENDALRSRLYAPRHGAGSRYRVECRTGEQEGSGAEAAFACDDPLAASGYTTVPGVAGFHTVLIRMVSNGDNVTRAMVMVANEHKLAGSKPFNLEAARKAIVDAQLDVLIAADPGIQPEMYALMFGRMAPVQIALWGQGHFAHTLSLGLPDTVDYYVVGDNGAADNIQDQFLEQTVRLGDVGVYFPRMKPLTPAERFAASRRHGLLEDKHLYLVPATLNALHPAFDDVLLGILAADPAGEALCLYETGQELWLATTRERLSRHPLVAHHGHSLALRVRFTADFVHAAHRDKWALMSAADVVLDTFPVGLAQTAMEAIEVGAPVVTLPSRQPLRPFAAGLLHRLNMTDYLVASNVHDYIAKAVRLGSDAEYRRSVRARLLGRRSLMEWAEPGQVRGALQERDVDTAAAAGLDPAIDRETQAWLSAMREAGYGDPAGSTLDDWTTFVGRAGRPWAADRKRSARLVKPKTP